MENLLKPDVGMMFWTVVTFLAMVLILKKIAWGPLLKALDEREEKIRKDIESARQNRDEVERLKQDYERQLGEIESRARALLSEAEQKGAKAREGILKEAEAEARKLAEKGRQQLEAEKEKLLLQLRKEVGDLSVSMAEKLMRQTIDKKVQDKFVQDFLKNLETPQDKLH
jgi:F-type H+-transporting ATPase subunit b